MFASIKDYAARVKRSPRPVRILVVDDEEGVRKFVDRVLNHIGLPQPGAYRWKG